MELQEKIYEFVTKNKQCTASTITQNIGRHGNAVERGLRQLVKHKFITAKKIKTEKKKPILSYTVKKKK